MSTSCPPPFAAARLVLYAVSLASAFPLSSRAAPEPAAAPKPYTLFVGVDFDVEYQQQYRRVHGIVGGSVVITAGTREVHIPMQDQSVRLRIRETLRLTDATVAITDLKDERVYTPGADPERKWARMGAGSDSSAALNKSVATQEALAQNQAQVSDPNLRPEIRAAIAQMTPTLQAASDNAAQSYDQAFNAAGSDLYNAGYNTMQMETELAKKLFDAIEVSFTISSPHYLADPYVVVLAQYHDPGEPAGTAHNWIYAEALGPIDVQPRPIHIRQGGFPPGFKVEDLHVHVYDHGQELASNVAEKRIALSRDEAFQYLVIDYLSSHKGATLPPTLAMGRLPAGARSGLSAGQLAQTFFVKVGKDGLPLGAFLDEACTHKADDARLDSIVGDCRFRPALADGKPVGGVAPLKLGDL